MRDTPEKKPLTVRLRERAAAARSEGTGTALGDAIHFEEAANRIEELVAVRAAARVRERDILLKNIEELREALRAILAPYKGLFSTDGHLSGCDMQTIGAAFAALEMASGKPDEGTP